MEACYGNGELPALAMQMTPVHGKEASAKLISIPRCDDLHTGKEFLSSSRRMPPHRRGPSLGWF